MDLLKETFIFLNKKEHTINDDEYNSLVELMKLHDTRYYTQDQPLIDDTEYDKLYVMLTNYEKEHPDKINKESSSQHIIGGIKSNLSKISHIYPMLSLKKTNAQEKNGLKNYLDKFVNNENDLWYTDKFLAQNKEDGLTIVLYFNIPQINNGHFTAATRGSGDSGEDVTASFINLENVRSIIKKVGDQQLIIRGEAIISKSDFEAINENGTFMNSRNLVAGSLRTLDSNVAKERKVQFKAYNIENAEDYGMFTELEQISFLNELGFNTTTNQLVVDNTSAGKNKLINYVYSFSEEDRDKVDHDIDGIVIKPNNIKNRREIGFTSHHPKNAIAFKFESPEAVTKLTDVVWQIGSTGQVTPVGIFEPINLLGANIVKATLASLKNIKKRDIKINDVVLVQRKNDVIPQIVKSFKEERTGNEIDIIPPENTHLDGELLFVDQENEEQLLNRWKKFVSKDGLNIDALSIETIKALNDNHLINLNDFSSIYNLNHDEFVSINRFGEQKWQNLQKSLENSKNVGLSKVLVSLSLKGVGRTFSGIFTQEIDSWDDLINKKENGTLIDWVNELVEKTNGFGDSTKDVILNTLLTDTVIDQVNKLALVGINLNSIKKEDKLNSLTFVITGSTNLHSRNEWKTIIELNGGHLSGSLSSKTDYLVSNSESLTTTKAKKAVNLNIPIINEEKLNSFF